MRLKTRWLFVFIAFSLLLLTYLYLGRMAMQFEFHPPKVNVESDSKSLLRKEIHVIPLNPNVVAPVIANPVALDQINDKTVYLNNAKEETSHLRSEFKETDVSYNVHAFYYPWYASKDVNGNWSHWNHKTIPHWVASVNKDYPQKEHVPPDDIASRFYPSLGPYSSSDPLVIHEHMKQLRKAGVGVMSVSWYPPQSKDPNAIIFVDELMPLILDIANEHAIKVCFHIEPYTDRSALSVKRDIEYIINTYGSHPAFYRYENLPLMYLYDSYIIDGSEWATIFSPSGEYTIRGTPYDIIAIGLFVERPHCQMLQRGGFNGFYTYFASQGFVYGSTLSNWKDMNQCVKGLQYPQLFIPSVGPGYDDLPVRPWNKGNVKGRETGTYYKQMWKETRNLRSKIVSITSFNEWHEGTQIESAVIKEGYEDYGRDPDLYLKLTREVQRFFM